MSETATRRELMMGAAGLGAAAALVLRPDAGLAATQSTQTSKALSYALQIERLSIIAYRQVLATNVLHANVRSQLQVHLGQELKHAAKLEQILTELGAPAPTGPDGVAAAQAILTQHQVHRSLTNPPNQHDAVRVLIDVESLAEGAYFAAIPALPTAAQIQACAEMMGTDAQHWTVLGRIQRPADVIYSVPYPFVQGSP